MAVMAAMAARQVMVRSEWTVVCRLWSLMLIRRKRVGVRQCGGDGEGGRAGAGESSRAMAAMAMMAVMAADNGEWLRKSSGVSKQRAASAQGGEEAEGEEAELQEKRGKFRRESSHAAQPYRKKGRCAVPAVQKKGRCAARNAPTKWTAGNEISFPGNDK